MFTARDLASGTMGRINGRLGDMQHRAHSASMLMGRGFAAMGAGATLMAAGFAGLSVVGHLATMAGDFDMAMAQAGARSRATASDLDLMRQASLNAAASGRQVFDPTQSAQGLELLAAAGQTAREAISSLTPTLGLATAGNISAESSARALISTLRAFSISADQSGHVADQLLAISNSTLLEARDLEAAMGAIGRGAGVAHQSLEEMLPAIGLVRNAGNSAEVSAHAVSAAMIYMGTHASDRFRDIGVSLEDGSGRFRRFLDIVMDVRRHIAERGLGDVETVELVNRLFGRFGMTAYSASAQIEHGITTSSGAIVRGAEALAYLRGQMENADGTIQRFLDQTLNTLPGQLQVLKAVASAVAVEMGAPLAAALKPAIQGLVGLLQRFRGAWNALPESFKVGAIRLFLFVSAAVSAFGAILFMIGAVAVLIPLAKVLAIAFGSVALIMLPLALGLGAVVGFIYLMARAVNENIGGMGSLVSVGNRVVLFVRALHAIFAEGGFSGALRTDLRRAENAGIRRFAIQIAALIFRIEAFIRGVAKGVDLFLRSAAPEIRALISSIRQLGASLGFVEGGLVGVTKQSSKAFGVAGLGAGRVLINIFRGMVDALRKVVDFLAGLKAGIADATSNNFLLQALAGIFGVIGAVIAWVASEVFGFKQGMITARDVGYVVGVGLIIVFGALAAVLAIVALSIGMVAAGMVALAAIVVVSVALMLAPILILAAVIWSAYRAYKALRGEAAPNLTETVTGAVSDMRNGISGGTRLGALGGARGNFLEGQQQRAAIEANRRAVARRTVPTISMPPTLDALSGTGTLPVAGHPGVETIVAELRAMRRTPPQVAVTTMLDGEVLARALTNGQQAGANREFSPAGGGEE